MFADAYISLCARYMNRTEKLDKTIKCFDSIWSSILAALIKELRIAMKVEKYINWGNSEENSDNIKTGDDKITASLQKIAKSFLVLSKSRENRIRLFKQSPSKSNKFSNMVDEKSPAK